MTPPHAPTHFVRQPISLCTALIVQTATSGASPESTDVSECVCEYVSECVCVSECVSECVCVCECVSLSTLSFSLSLSTALCASLSLNKVVQKKTTQWHAMQRFLLNSHLTHVHWRCDIHMHLCQAVVPFQKQEKGGGGRIDARHQQHRQESPCCFASLVQRGTYKQPSNQDQTAHLHACLAQVPADKVVLANRQVREHGSCSMPLLPTKCWRPVLHHDSGIACIHLLLRFCRDSVCLCLPVCRALYLSTRARIISNTFSPLHSLTHSTHSHSLTYFPQLLPPPQTPPPPPPTNFPTPAYTDQLPTAWCSPQR